MIRSKSLAALTGAACIVLVAVLYAFAAPAAAPCRYDFVAVPGVTCESKGRVMVIREHVPLCVCADAR